MTSGEYLQRALHRCNTDTPNWYGWADVSAGETYENVVVVKDGVTKPTLDEVNAKIAEVKLDELRGERNYRISKTDWTQSPDSPLSDSDKTAWVTYRQSLRDITDTATSLEDVTWPTKP